MIAFSNKEDFNYIIYDNTTWATLQQKDVREEPCMNITELANKPGRSIKDGNIGRKDPVDIKAGTIFRNDFSNLQGQIDQHQLFMLTGKWFPNFKGEVIIHNLMQY